MGTANRRTPERTLIIGCTSFAGLDSIAWTDQTVPNIPDYDLIVVSVPHIKEDFLQTVESQFLEDMRKALVRFLHSGGKMIILTSRHSTIKRPSRYPEYVSTGDWCPISYETPNEDGKSIIWRSEAYSSYLKKMTGWSFYLTIPHNCLTDELTKFYGSTYDTKYEVPLQPYLENRYGRILAGECCVEVRGKREKSNEWGNTWSEYPKSPDVTTGKIVLLPLIENMSAEEALTTILYEEVGYSDRSPEPDWVQEEEMPFVADLMRQISEGERMIATHQEKIRNISAKVEEINSFRRLLYATGPELQDIVQRSFERLGAKVSPAKYSQEEYILHVNGEEFLMEVKGVSKSISLTHLRQLNDYLLKYQEDTGKKCKGILFGNPWRSIPPHDRGASDTPIFPDNVIKRAEEWGISLVSSVSFFRAFVKALEDDCLTEQILTKILTAKGVAEML